MRRMKFVCVCVCVFVCLSLDNLSTNTSILFILRTKVDICPDQTPIDYEHNWMKTDKTARPFRNNKTEMLMKS